MYFYSRRHGDWVQFQVATDRRDSLRRATRISLLHESFSVSGERREGGVVTSVSLAEGYGWIRAAEREPRLLFKLGEVLDKERGDVQVNEEVEFTTVQVRYCELWVTEVINLLQSLLSL